MPTDTPLTQYLRLQRALDRDVLASLRVAAASVDSELRRLQARTGIGNEMREAQLAASQAAINREMAAHWTRVGNATAAQQATAAADAAEAMFQSSTALSSVFDAADLDYMTRSVRDSAQRGLENAMERVSGSSYVPLADSVYQNAALSSGHIGDLVNAALTRGASAAELARDVRAYVNPDTPGGARYASMRLARTELNNAFHASQIRQAQANPWTTGVLWNLSGSHPVPDECNQYAEEEHFTDGDPGVFRPSEVPAKPHPNCLCYTTTVDDDVDEFMRKFEAGDYDDYLTGLGLPDEVVESAAATSRAASRPKALEGMESHQTLANGYASWLTKNGTSVQQEAFNRYTRVDAYKRWNPHMRGQAADVTQQDLDQIEELRTLIQNSPALEQPVSTFRGIRDPDSVFGSGSMPEGTIFQDDAFMSTTMDDAIRDYYKGTEGSGAIVNIRVPEGTKVGIAETEGQVVLAPGTRLRIISDRMERTIKDPEGYKMLTDDALREGWSDEKLNAQLERWKVVSWHRVIEAEVV